MINKGSTKPNTHAMLLLFLFSFGAVLTLLYKEKFAAIPNDIVSLATYLLFISFLDLCLMASNVNGAMFLMLAFPIMGASSAVIIDAFLTGHGGEIIRMETMILLALVPICFCIGNWGINNCLNIRKVLKSKSRAYKKDRFISYLIMILGVSVSVLTAHYIMII